MVAKVAFLFPGQGSQYVGMGRTAYDQSDRVKELFAQADEIMGFSLSKIMFGGPEEELRQTTIAQPALFLASAAALEQIRSVGIQPSWVAGHSLGEYSALYAAGVFSFTDGLRLVMQRGKAMQQAAQTAKGAMAAIIGLDGEKVKMICLEVSAQSGVCVPANFNADTQVVVSGTEAAVSAAMEKAQAQGAKAVRLNVSGAFHSPLMQPAAQKMKTALDSAGFSDASLPVLTNVDSALTTKSHEFREKLVRQIDHAVCWHETMVTLVNLGADTFLEIGAGKVLSSMVRRLDRKKNVCWTDEFDTVQKVFSELITK